MAFTDEEIDAWEAVYTRWETLHRFVFGMNGPEGGPRAHDLFLKWEHWLFKIHPTEKELEDATEWLAGFVASFEAKWESHYARIRTRIQDVRQTASVGVWGGVNVTKERLAKEALNGAALKAASNIGREKE